MRSAILLVAFVLAVPAQADQPLFRVFALAEPVPSEFFTLPENFQAGIRFGDETFGPTWIIPALTPADTRTVFTLNAANAASYGVNLDTMMQALRENPRAPYLFLRTDPTTFIAGPRQATGWPGTLSQYVDHSTIHSVEFRFQEGRFQRVGLHVWVTLAIPEPSTLLLALFAIAGSFGMRRRT